MKVGIIGNGFVGNAIYQNIKFTYKTLRYDTNPELSDCKAISDITEQCEYVFVAVPTPMHLDGHPDLSIVFDVMDKINQSYNNNLIILKSTVVPGTCRAINERHPEMRIVFSPEFLTEANSVEDFRLCNRVIFGGQENDTQKCVDMMRWMLPDKQYETTDWGWVQRQKHIHTVQ